MEWFFVMMRHVTPANRPLQHLEAGHLGASTPQHVMSRPAVPDLCIASTNLLSLIDPLPMDRLSQHTVAAVCSWPAVDRHHILAVTNRDVRVARQNLAELQLYVDDHAAHLANCASADDDEIALMSAELLPRLEGGIRAALDESRQLISISFMTFIRTLCVGVRSPSDSTDRDIQTFIIIYVTTGSNFYRF